MAVTLPPWLQIDPIAPARIKLQANQQRNAAAAAERASQNQAAELQFRREALNAQLAQQAEHDEAVERSAVRREQVYKQTQDTELAQAAQQMQMQREVQAEKSRQFEQNLRLKQKKAEQEALVASKQMIGMQALEKGLQAGEPLQKLLMENAPNLFYGRPQDMAKVLPRNKVNLDPNSVVARPLLTESGQDTGEQWYQGAGGGVNLTPRRRATPEALLNADKALLAITMSELEENPKDPQLLADRVAIKKRIKDFVASGRGGATPNASGALPGAPSGTPAPIRPPVAPTPAQAAAAGERIRIQNAKGETFSTYKNQWDTSTPEERKGWTVIDEEDEEEANEEQ
jgi:hypothetical protein